MPHVEHHQDGSLTIRQASPAGIESLERAVGADGRWLVLSCGGYTSACWPVDDPSASVTLEAGGGLKYAETLALAVGAQGEEVVLGRGRRGRLWRWDRAGGRLLAAPRPSMLLEVPSFGRYPMAVAGSGTRPVLCTDSRRGGLQRWDALTGTPLGDPMAPGTLQTWALATAPWPGRDAELFVSGGSDGLIRRWDPNTGEEVGEPIAGCGRATSLAVLPRPDGGVAVVVLDTDGLVHRRDLRSGAQVGAPMETGWRPPDFAGAHLCRGWLAVTAAADGAGGQVAVCTGPTEPILLWDAESGDRLARIEREHHRIGPVSALTGVSLGDGTALVLVGDVDGRVHRLHARTGEPVTEAVSPHGTQPSLAVKVVLGDGSDLLAVVGNDHVYRFDAHSGLPYADPGRPWALVVQSLTSARLADGATVLVAAADDGIERLDAATGIACPRHADERTTTIWDVAVVALPDGRVLIAGAGQDGGVYRWDASTGEAFGEVLKGHEASVKAVTTTVTAEGKPVILSGCEAGQIRCWDAVTGLQIGEAQDTDSGAVASLAILDRDAGAKTLVCADGGGRVRCSDLSTQAPVGAPVSVGGWPEILAAFQTQDGTPVACVRHAAGFEQETTGLWRLDDGRQLESALPGNTIGLIELAGRLFAVAGSREGAVTVSMLPEPFTSCRAGS